MILYEVRATKKRVIYPIKLMNAEQRDERFGFMSVYGYPDETASLIEIQGHTAGLAGMEFYSDMLYVDFDDEPEAAHAMGESLREYDWYKYDSGGRSIHYHIPITPMQSAEVPMIQREWMKEHYVKADHSIYKSSGVYRMIGTWHEKQRRPKLEIDRNITSKILTLTIPETKLADIRTAAIAGDLEEKNRMLDFQLMKIIQTGGRNAHVFALAAQTCDLGIELQESIELITIWNRQYCNPPIGLAEINSTARSAYSGARR